MSPALTERLVQIAKAAKEAGHGKKGPIYDAACEELGMSRASLLKKLSEVTVMDKRKRRNDAGKTALTRDEALLISATLRESTRKNDKRLFSIPDAVDALRANGMITAGTVDSETGEINFLSDSAIHRALRGYGLHPDQLNIAAPATQLASLHPNHVWEIDASLCVLYYLNNGKKDVGLHVMDHKKFYKNKPNNLKSIMNDRVWSYEITDHTTGWIYVEYVLGAESGANMCSVLINAMQERGGADVMHGRPSVLYLDPGSANTASMTKNLCKSLGITLIAHKAHNARATGQVEQARNIIECKFEPGLKFRAVNSLEELNALAKKWRENFNATAIHSRYNKTRTDSWLRITAEQLIKVPSVEICRELAVSAPESRKVTDHLQVPFKGRTYDASSIPGVLVGDSLMITRNPWRTDAAQVVLMGEDGFEYFHLINEVETDENGFAVGAPVIGQNFKSHAETSAQKSLQEIELIVTGTDTAEEAAAARKAKQLPFNRQFDPYKRITDTELPTYLPKRGTESPVRAMRIEERALTHVEAAKLLREKFKSQGLTWSADHYAVLVKQYPDGIKEDGIDAVFAGFVSQATRPTLSVVNGGL